METTKIKIKVGPHDFEAEGPTDFIKILFEGFRELVSSGGGNTVSEVAKDEQQPVNDTEFEKNANDTASQDAIVAQDTPPGIPGQFRDNRLNIVFSNNTKGRFVSLRMWKKESGVADALLLIMLGFRLVRDETEIKVSQLKASLVDSGFPKNRVDEASRAHVRDGLIVKYGKAGPGGLYRLTARGQSIAEGIYSDLVKDLA